MTGVTEMAPAVLRALLTSVLASCALTAAAAQASVTADSFARAEVAHYAAPLALDGPIDCLGPAVNADPGTQAWRLRDAVNQYCATQRMLDEYSSPAFGSTFWPQAATMYADQNVTMAMDPGHLHVSLSQFIPGGTTTDPFRTVARWQAAGLGSVTPISFPASDGATLNGFVFSPPAKGHDPYSGLPFPSHHPGVVITTGSIQGYQNMYFWAAEALAEAGYVVLTYDVQGQGNSDALPAHCNPGASCPGVPFQQPYNFYQGAEDALNFFFSTPAAPYTSPNSTAAPYNPAWAQIDTAHVGIAGHSLGAGAVSEVAQCDPRVKAVVAWDNLAPTTAPCRASIPAGLPANAPADPVNTVPALGINSEYFLNPQPLQSPPDPQGRAAAFAQLAAVHTDAMQVALRESTHLEYTYVPYILPASRLGERVASYYTLAWFDRYLRDQASGYGRLVASTFDNSADVHSIGAGAYDPALAAQSPADTAAGNVPWKIAGLAVADRLSFYYDSEYAISNPTTGTPSTCNDMRASCPAIQPRYP